MIMRVSDSGWKTGRFLTPTTRLGLTLIVPSVSPPYTRSLPHSSRDTRCDCKEVSVDREWMW